MLNIFSALQCSHAEVIDSTTSTSQSSSSSEVLHSGSGKGLPKESEIAIERFDEPEKENIHPKGRKESDFKDNEVVASVVCFFVFLVFCCLCDVLFEDFPFARRRATDFGSMTAYAYVLYPEYVYVNLCKQVLYVLPVGT